MEPNIKYWSVSSPIACTCRSSPPLPPHHHPPHTCCLLRCGHHGYGQMLGLPSLFCLFFLTCTSLTEPVCSCWLFLSDSCVFKEKPVLLEVFLLISIAASFFYSVFIFILYDPFHPEEPWEACISQRMQVCINITPLSIVTYNIVFC